MPVVNNRGSLLNVIYLELNWSSFLKKGSSFLSDMVQHFQGSTDLELSRSQASLLYMVI